MRPFEFLLNATATTRLIELPADEQWAAVQAFQAMADHPFTTGLPHWTDPAGRENHLRFVQGWMITFAIDHAERKIRIVDFTKP
ncbi:MAG: hypothetical protein HZA93_27700 [Verrucomicrobia bacterium]|nr:hypothetical protein [Verrucomicrobiota bacterium]